MQKTDNRNNNLFKAAAYPLRLHKQDSVNGTCACWRRTKLYPVSKQHSKQNKWNNDLFKFKIAIALESRKQDDTDGLYAVDTGQITMK